MNIVIEVHCLNGKIFTHYAKQTHFQMPSYLQETMKVFLFLLKSEGLSHIKCSIRNSNICTSMPTQIKNYMHILYCALWRKSHPSQKQQLPRALKVIVGLPYLKDGLWPSLIFGLSKTTPGRFLCNWAAWEWVSVLRFISSFTLLLFPPHML